MKRRIRAGVAVLIAAIVGTSASAFAGTPDQSQTATDGSLGTVGGGVAQAQTFTAGISGALDRVDLRMVEHPICPSGEDVTVRIRRVFGGEPSGPTLAAKTVPGESIDPPEWVVFGFATPTQVTAEKRYAIVASSPDVGECDFGGGFTVPAGQAWGSESGNPYPRGDAFFSRDGGDTWEPVPAAADHTFATYVVPANCKGQNATILGTSGADELVGTDANDVIVGGGGKDTLKGLGGKDKLCGLKGKDKLKGGGGKDKLKGGKGKDRLVGGGGRDKCVGGKGDDIAKKCEVERSV